MYMYDLQDFGTTPPSDHAYPMRNQTVWNSASRYSTHLLTTRPNRRFQVLDFC